MVTWNQQADFEEGNLSDFDSTVGTGLSASTASAMVGTYGFEVAITDSNVRYGQLSGLTDQKIVVFEMKIDPNGLVMGIGEMFILGQMLGSGVFATSMWVQCGYSELNHQIRYIYFNDYSNSGTSSFYDLPDAPCTITVVWVASSGPGADDGFIELYIDGDHKETITGIDNDGYDVDAINVGAVAGMDAGTSGALYFDEIKWSDDLVRFPAPLNAALTILVPTVALRSARRLYARRRDTNLLVEA